MMSESSPEVLEQNLRRMEQLSIRLLEVLERERRALIGRSLPDLDAITSEKADLCRGLDHAVAALGPVPLRECIAALPPAEQPALERAHERLLELTRRVQNCNAVNGKIVHRSQQSVRELMHLMSGTDTDGLYSARGYKAQGTTSTRPPGTAIAKA